MNAAEKIAWIRLIQTENVGPVTFHNLINRFGNATGSIKAIGELSKRGGRKKPLIPPPERDIKRYIDDCAKSNIHIITSHDDTYPELLKHIDDAPPVLYVRGHLSLLQSTPMVAMVGARNASIAGCKFAEKIARDLVLQNITVVSGLARGIDTAAHIGSVEKASIAVVAGGVDHHYPPENKNLQNAIAEGGAVIAENIPGTVPQARHFPRRNRIISGMTQATIVVEATMRSGSLITARMAGEQGREVLAVPGSPMDPRCAGTNKLLKEGATLLENVDDVLVAVLRAHPVLKEYTKDNITPYMAPDDGDIAKARESIENVLSSVPVGLDEILRSIDVPASIAQLALLELELAGRIQRYHGGKIALVF